MRAILLMLWAGLLSLTLAGSLGAASCDDDLRSCYRTTILLNTPEAFDLAGCNADYVLCLDRTLRFV